MLKHLYIRNFVFIDTLELTLNSGVIMITGETGAGKSIILGAIDAALGQRSAHEKIKLGESEAEIILTFDLTHNKKAKDYLEENALNNDEESDCIIRRVIYKDGKTRNFINGRPSNISALRELGELLLLLHTQNENQILLSTSGQTQLLDAYAGTQSLLDDIGQCVSSWKKIESEIKLLTSKSGEKNQRLDYLRYQHQELAEAKLDLEEIQTLPAKHKALSSAKETIELYEAILSAFSPSDSMGVLDLLKRLRQPILAVEKLSRTSSLSELLNNALINLEELSDNTKHLINTVDINPEKLMQIEERIAELHQLARKHHLNPEELPALLNSLEQEIDDLNASEQKLVLLEKEKVALEKNYQELALSLTKKRTQSAKTLSKKVTDLIHELGMPTAIFSIALQTLETLAPNSSGAEQAAFMMQANAHYPEVPLKKTASGGELARVSLALQTLLAAYIQIPTLILDEIDIGVGGKIAAMIGQQLRKLGATHQVICVTHQPQIAASGDQHLKVEKNDQKQKTIVTVSALNNKQRVNEIARMLGGLTVTEHALQHAQEMLEAFRLS